MTRQAEEKEVVGIINECDRVLFPKLCMMCPTHLTQRVVPNSQVIEVIDPANTLRYVYLDSVPFSCCDTSAARRCKHMAILNAFTIKASDVKDLSVYERGCEDTVTDTVAFDIPHRLGQGLLLAFVLLVR